MATPALARLQSQLAAARTTHTDGRHARAAEAYAQVVEGGCKLRDATPEDNASVRHDITILLSEACCSAGYNHIKNFNQPAALAAFKDALKFAKEGEHYDPLGVRIQKGYAYAGMSLAYKPKSHDDPRRAEYANKAKELAHACWDDACQNYADVGGKFVIDTQEPEVRLMANRFIAGEAVEDTTLTSGINKARMLVAAAERAAAKARVSK